MSSPSADATLSGSMEVSPLLKNEDVLGSLLCWLPLDSIGRIGQCSKALRGFVSSDPHQSFWLAHLLQRLNVPSREVGTVNIAPDQSAKSLLQAHIRAPQPAAQAHNAWDYHRDDDESTLSIRGVSGTGWDAYKIDNIVDGESSRYMPGHDFSARCRAQRIPRVPYPVVRRRRAAAGDGKVLLDVGLSSIFYFEARLESRNDRRLQRPNALQEEDNLPPPQACVAIGLSTGGFRLSQYQPGWTEDSIGYHSDDGRLFFASGTDGTNFGPNYGNGDVVGCGVHIPTMSVFFTKNGNLIGTAYSIISSEPRTYRCLYPTIGLDSKEFTIQVSFGAGEAFAFDISKVEQLYANYPAPVRHSARLNSQSDQSATGSNVDNALNPSEILERIGLVCTYPDEAASFHPWNRNAATARIYVQQRDSRRYMWLHDSDDSDDFSSDDGDEYSGDEDGILEDMFGGYDYASYDDSTYGDDGGDDDDMGFDSDVD